MKKSLLLFALALVVGCTTLGVPTPPDFLSGVAAAQISVTTLKQAALDALNAGSINAKQAEAVRTAGNSGNTAIDVAVDAYVAVCPAPAASAPAVACAAPATATSKLAAAVALLTDAQALLNTYKGK